MTEKKPRWNCIENFESYFWYMQNLVTELIAIVEFVRIAQQKKLSHSEYSELLQDVIGKLCVVISSCLSAPLQGRLSLALPHSYVPLEEQQKSLLDQKEMFYGQS